MRTPLIASLVLAAARSPKSPISALPAPTRPPEPVRSCPYRPFGGDSWLNHRVVSASGDTLRDAHLTVRRHNRGHTLITQALIDPSPMNLLAPQCGPDDSPP
jgi:hypothetical protein